MTPRSMSSSICDTSAKTAMCVDNLAPSVLALSSVSLIPLMTTPSPGSIFQIQTNKGIFVTNFSKKGKKKQKSMPPRSRSSTGACSQLAAPPCRLLRHGTSATTAQRQLALAKAACSQPPPMDVRPATRCGTVPAWGPPRSASVVVSCAQR